MSLNLGTALESSARRHPERIAVLHHSRSVTYQELDFLAKCLARGLAQIGIVRGDRVALMLPNVVEFPIAYFGALYAGASVVTINPLAADQEIKYFLENSDSRVVIAHSSCFDSAVAAAVDARIPVYSHDQLSPAAEHGLCAWGPIKSLARTEPSDTAVIQYTSGTTGRPKGAELTHANLLINSTVLLPSVYQTLPDPFVGLAVMPLFHCFGQNAIQNVTLALGGTMTLIERFDARVVWEVLKRDKVHLFGGVPTLFISLLQEHPESYDGCHLKYCIGGGAPLPPAVIEAWQEFAAGVRVYDSYGLSETSPPSCSTGPDVPWKPGSVGVPTWGTELSIQDGEGNELEDGLGEVCIRGWGIFKGYLNDPAATVEAIDDRGWFHSGDIGRRDEDGVYWIVDRIKSMIIRGGHNIYPREVEDVLYQHPAVAEAAVMGIPDDRLGEEVKAAVALHSWGKVTEEELQQWCRERLSPYKYPRVFEFRDALPQGATGKIQKRDFA